MFKTPYQSLESIHIKIISGNLDISQLPAFNNCEHLSAENWSKGIDELAKEIHQQSVDILYLASPPSSKDILKLCTALKSNMDNGLSVFIISLPEPKKIIQQAYALGVSAYIDLPIIDVHFEHQLTKCSQNKLRQKQLEKQYKQQSFSHQISKLYDFTWHKQQQNFYLTAPTKQLLGLNTPSSIVSQHDFIQQLSEINRAPTAQFLNSINNQQPRIQTKIKVSQGSVGDKHLLFTAELDKSSRGDLIYQGVLQDMKGIHDVDDYNHHFALHDSLTGLANRRYLMNKLESLIQLNELEKQSFSILFLDLDGFKQVNDQLGHEMGDLLLIEVSQHLQQVSQPDLFIARLGGDEFCIVVEHNKPLKKTIALDLAKEIIYNFKHSLFLQKNQVHTSFSIGIANFPTHGQRVSDLLKSADLAMYKAKAKGKNCYKLYSPKLIEKSLKRIHIEKELYQAYKSNQFEIYYQPQVDLSSQNILGIEALIRWIHPNKGIILPDEFISIAEETRLINKIGHWALKKACEDAQYLHKKGLKISVAINVSPIQLYHDDICNKVKNVLIESGLEPQYLELEITESSFQVTDRNISIFNQLRNLGVKIAIDDFGTGYSNLASLRHLPIDVLKIDRDFIKDIPHDNAAAAMAGSIIGMARIKSLKVVAEGIETIEQVQFLQGVNCDIGQGYFIGQPMEFSQIMMFLKRQKNTHLNLLEQKKGV